MTSFVVQIGCYSDSGIFQKSTLESYTPAGICSEVIMAHTVRDKTRLLHRVRRIRGQIDAVARALENEQECIDILQLMTACRGAMNSLMAELVEGHIRFHVMNSTRRTP